MIEQYPTPSVLSVLGKESSTEVLQDRPTEFASVHTLDVGYW